MATPVLPLLCGGLLGVYIFLSALLRLTQDAREPPAIEAGLPFLAPLLGIMREKSRYHIRLR